MRSSMNSPNDTPLDAWGSCPPGELQRLVGRLNVIEHCAKRKQICLCGASALLLVAGVVVGIGILRTPDIPGYGGLTCQQCQSHFVAYHNYLLASSSVRGTPNSLNRVARQETGKNNMAEIMAPALAKKMAKHLAMCPRCRPKFNSLYPGLLANRLGRGLGLMASGIRPLQARMLFAVTRVPAAI